MYRQGTFHTTKGVSPRSDSRSIAEWQKDVAYNSKDPINRYRNSESPQIIVNNVTGNSAVDVYCVRQAPEFEGEISTKAVISTILGASAGAAVAYAMATSGADKSSKLGKQHLAYPTITIPPPRVTEVIHQRPKSGTSLHRGIEVIDLEDAGTRVKTLASSRPGSHLGPAKSARESHSGKTLVRTSRTKAFAGNPETSSKPSRSGTGRDKESGNSRSIKTARNVPLPPSRISSNLTPSTSGGGKLNDLGTVVPDDSISQVSTRRSSESPSAHRHTKSGHGKKHTRHSSHGSSRTIKASDRYVSKSGSHRR